MNKLLRRNISFALIIFLFVSCATLPDFAGMNEQEAVYNQGLFYEEHGSAFNNNYTKAIEAYNRVIYLYHNSKYEPLARIHKSDVLFKLENYAKAAVEFDRFLELYPYNPISGYAKFKQALCYYELSDDYDRDLQYTKIAYNGFGEFLYYCQKNTDINTDDEIKNACKFFVNEAEEKRTEMENNITKRELYIAKFYLKRGYVDAAKVRLEQLIKSYPLSDNSIKAKEILSSL